MDAQNSALHDENTQSSYLSHYWLLW
jgi:hypothetical protein